MRTRTFRGIGACIAAAAIIALAAPGAAQAVDNDRDPDASAPSTLGERIEAAAATGADDPEALAAAAALPTEGAGSLTFDGEGRIAAAVLFEGRPSEALLAQVGAIAEIDQVTTFIHSAAVMVDPERLGEFEALDGVASAVPSLRPESGGAGGSLAGTLRDALGGIDAGPIATTPTAPAAPADCRSIPVEAAGPQKVDLARAEFDVDGSGVTIGIISDSFGSIAGGEAADIAAGALPGPGNPCGYTQKVEVIRDQAGVDEGRAMAQLVHGIAPGAKIVFADHGENPFVMSERIIELAEAGADVIVDDITQYSEPYYQAGPVAAAVEMVQREHGITYFTSAGNPTGYAETGPGEKLPLNSWQTRAYRPMDCPAWLVQDDYWTRLGEPGDPLAGNTDIDCLDFDPSEGAELPYDTLAVGPDPGRANVVGSIGEPFAGVTTSYEVRFYVEDAGDPSADPLLISSHTSFGSHYPGLFGSVDVSADTNVRMVFVRTAYDPDKPNPAVYLGFSRGATSFSERHFLGNGTTDWVGEGVFGHSADGRAIAVGATYWDEPYNVTYFSAVGPGTMLFDPFDPQHPLVPANRLGAADIVDSPGLVAISGAQTTFFGEEEDGVRRFEGTSASAPNAAAVAVLAKQLAPELGPDELKALLQQTADGSVVNRYEPRFSDANVFGAGLVNAHALLAEVARQHPRPTPTPPQPTPTPTPTPPTPSSDSSGSGSSSASGSADSGAGSSSGSRAADGNTAAGSLSQTGGASAMPWIVGGAIVVLLGAGLVTASVMRRRRAVEAPESAESPGAADATDAP